MPAFWEKASYCCDDRQINLKSTESRPILVGSCSNIMKMLELSFVIFSPSQALRTEKGLDQFISTMYSVQGTRRAWSNVNITVGGIITADIMRMLASPVTTLQVFCYRIFAMNYKLIQYTFIYQSILFIASIDASGGNIVTIDILKRKDTVKRVQWCSLVTRYESSSLLSLPL